MPPNTAYVGRGSKYGNPYLPTHQYEAFWQKIGYAVPLVKLRSKPSLDLCLDRYVAKLHQQLIENPNFLEPLRGKNLACWCALDQPCHADILLRLANEWGPESEYTEPPKTAA